MLTAHDVDMPADRLIDTLWREQAARWATTVRVEAGVPQGVA
jgi:hypothetical protein